MDTTIVITSLELYNNFYGLLWLYCVDFVMVVRSIQCTVYYSSMPLHNQKSLCIEMMYKE